MRRVCLVDDVGRHVRLHFEVRQGAGSVAMFYVFRHLAHLVANGFLYVVRRLCRANQVGEVSAYRSLFVTHLPDHVPRDEQVCIVRFACRAMLQVD